MQTVALNLYPVKSMRGVAVQQAEIGMQGFVGDREWLVADDQGRFITAREVERMLLWQPEIITSGIRLWAPDGASLDVHRAHYQEAADVTVWKDRFQAYRGPAEADAWLSAHLGLACHLFYLGSQPHRSLAANGGGALSFADGAPYLLTTQASLAALNSLLNTPITMRRFRANIVVDGHTPYAEDGWKTLRIGKIAFTGFKPCGRCKIVNLDPDTAQLSATKEPLKTLAKSHQLPQGACFGINLYAHTAIGHIQIGDEVVCQTP